jgi:hypothetical protein
MSPTHTHLLACTGGPRRGSDPLHTVQQGVRWLRRAGPHTGGIAAVGPSHDTQQGPQVAREPAANQALNAEHRRALCTTCRGGGEEGGGRGEGGGREGGGRGEGDGTESCKTAHRTTRAPARQCNLDHTAHSNSLGAVHVWSMCGPRTHTHLQMGPVERYRSPTPWAIGCCPLLGTRPLDGLCPNTPLKNAGMRMEPPTSDPAAHTHTRTHDCNHNGMRVSTRHTMGICGHAH